MFCVPSPSAVLGTEPRKLFLRPVGTTVLPSPFFVLLLCVCVYVRVCTWRLEIDVWHLPRLLSSLYFVRHGFSQILGLSHLSRLADPLPSGVLWVLPSQHCQQGHVLHLLSPPHLLCGFVEKGLPFIQLLSGYFLIKELFAFKSWWVFF